jgi:ring-1,2-phenylacetyl-CoA epoxidase subunit PaaD
MKKFWDILSTVTDPEVPVLTILDLGIVRKIEWVDDVLHVTITSTYTGCPAMDVISISIKLALAEHGYNKVTVTQSLSPAWTTDWITDEGKQKLLEYGIAPPNKNFSIAEDGVPCPQCGSAHTTLVSEFGSTACKALYTCTDCKEPFDYFKCY